MPGLRPERSQLSPAAFPWERSSLIITESNLRAPKNQVSITLHIAVLNEQALKWPRRHHKSVPQVQKHKDIMVLL